MPLARRLPKRGFTNPTRVAYQVVNLKDLQGFETGAVIDVGVLRGQGMAKRRMPVKVLGAGELSHALTVRVHAFSESARKAIESAGGSTEVVPVHGMAEVAL
jgi:large subunit ribosomal protein L15